MKSIVVLFALAFGGPVLMAATLIGPNAAAFHDVAAWALMLLGIGVTGLALRMERTVFTWNHVKMDDLL